ncbi:hypothetical protein, partial [Streptomyces sp. P17]|uniref:hypothetical protein n=1 Tax=Streptomyces sp. P17 TaxID=3074716 RepID=UPI0028F3FD02
AHYDWPAAEKRIRKAIDDTYGPFLKAALSEPDRAVVQAQRDLAEVQVIIARVVIALKNAGISARSIDALMALTHATWTRTMISNATDRACAGEIFARGMNGDCTPAAA